MSERHNQFRVALHGAGDILNNTTGLPINGVEKEWLVRTGNALAGVADPAAELAALRAERDELRAALKATMHAVDLALCGTPSAHYFTELKARLGGQGYTLEDNLKLNMADIKGACTKAHQVARAALARAERKA